MMQLPDKPSELITVALADLEKIEQRPADYRVQMGDWHAYNEDTAICEVCLAGAVMAMSLGITPSETVSFGDSHFSESVWDKLDALDEFRRGDVSSALCLLRVDTEIEFEDIDVPPYHRNPNEFKTAMAQLADKLEQSGL